MVKMTPKVVSKGTLKGAGKGGPASVVKGPSTPIGKGIVAVRNKMPKSK